MQRKSESMFTQNPFLFFALMLRRLLMVTVISDWSVA
jgi:hypothetical protein